MKTNHIFRLFATLALLLILLPLPTFSAGRAAHSPAGWSDGSLLFVENVGQFDPRARFQVRGGPDTLWLAEDALWLTLAEAPRVEASERPDERPQAEPRRAINLRLSFVGTNPHPRLEPFHRLETRVSYFIGDDPARWRTHVPVWGGVRYTDIYPGVDLVVGTGLVPTPGRPQGPPLPWQLEVRDGADLSAVRLRVEGAENVAVEGGHLYLHTPVGQVALPLPTAKLHTTSPAAPQPEVKRVGEQVFDVTAPLADAPSTGPDAIQRQVAQDATSLTLAYATYLGGWSYDHGYDVAVDNAGNAYLAGSTQSPDFPTTPGAAGEFYNGGDYDAFVVKLNNTGSALEFATFLGGVGDDWGDDFGYGVAVDGGGNVYVTGWTDSHAFPVSDGAYDTTYNGGIYDAFVAKLNPTGTALLYATFLGGDDQEKGIDVEADDSGNAYVTGWTASADFPSVAADSGFDTFHGGETDVFVAKLNAAGSALQYALFVGGSGLDMGTALAVDAGGYAYVTGWTESSDFPWRLAFDYDLDGSADAFVACVRPSGSSLFYSTYLGGSSDEIGWNIALDGAGDAYVVGTTDSTDLPVTTGAFSTSYNGGYSDAFVAKLSVNTLDYATYLGSSDDEQGYGIAVDAAGSAYITGDMGDDAITRLNPTGSDVDYRFIVADFEVGDAIAVGAQGGIYVLGYTSYGGLPVTPGAWDDTAAYEDIWLAKVASPAHISGRVMNSAGQPLAGVQIAASGVFSATTDASGQYTLTVPAGVQAFAPTTSGYFWSPASRSATVPPDATGQDFVGKGVAKDMMPASPPAADYGSTLTYTVRLVAPENRAVALYDPVPTYTTFISGSLNGPPGVSYDAASNAVSGTLTLTSNIPLTVTFGVQVEVTGTVSYAPRIVNRACVHPPGSALTNCEWSNETTTHTYLCLVYLPLIMR